ncbi:unnamed protein product [Cuscuta campestris]|uniref:Uncharacterized protein n=1 Tax=Cuscuta campestris TaxID=132261 RepID=A0A484MMR5_9ASTE|nr:unnamed protein product [Cuscuta campestris]
MVNYYSLKVMEKRRFRSRNVSIVVAGAQTEKTLDVAEVEVGGPGKVRMAVGFSGIRVTLSVSSAMS